MGRNTKNLPVRGANSRAPWVRIARDLDLALTAHLGGNPRKRP